MDAECLALVGLDETLKVNMQLKRDPLPELPHALLHQFRTSCSKIAFVASNKPL